MDKIVLLGYPLRYSVSPAFQQAALDYCHLPVTYEAWPTAEEDFPAAMGTLRSPELKGANITVPYKERALEFIDRLEGEAALIGAVNTVAKAGGALLGHNTDAHGFLQALQERGGYDPTGCRALLLGAGGAARAVAFALAGAGVSSIVIANRTPARGEALAHAIAEYLPGTQVRSHPLEDVTSVLDNTDLVVNCTPLGTVGLPEARLSPLSAAMIPGRAFVYDLVYNPSETPLLRAAKKAGARTLGGLSMLVYQGARSFELWTGREAPLDVMFRAAERALGL